MKLSCTCRVHHAPEFTEAQKDSLFRVLDIVGHQRSLLPAGEGPCLPGGDPYAESIAQNGTFVTVEEKI